MKLYKEASLMMLPTSVKDGKLYSIFPQPKVISSELVTNGEFDTDSDWSKGTGCTISDGKAKFTSAASGQGFTQSNFLTIGKIYKVAFTVSDYSEGAVKVRYPFNMSNTITANGSYVEYGEATTDDLFFQNVGTSTLSIDNVSVVEVDQVPADFDFSRGSNLAATRINEQGLIEKGRENLLLQSNQFDTTWTTTGASTPTGGQSGYDGSSDAWLLEATSTSARVVQNNTTSGVQTFSCYAKAGTANYIAFYNITSGSVPRAWFNLSNGTIQNSLNNIDAKIESLSNGWYRCSLTYNATLSNVRIYVAVTAGTFSDTTSGDNIYIQDAQLEAGLVATDHIESGATTGKAGVLEDLPRLDWSGDCPSLLLEPQRTNIVPVSEGVPEGTRDVVLTENYATSPDGNQNSLKVQKNGDSGNDRIFPISSGNATLVNGNSYSISAFVKNIDVRDTGVTSIGCRVVGGSLFRKGFEWDGNSLSIASTSSSGNPTNVFIEDYGNNWWRIGFTFEADGTDGNFELDIDRVFGSDTTSIETWGWQLEEGSYATSYIPTHGTSVTRAYDFFNNTDLGDFIGTGDATFFFNFDFDVVRESGAYLYRIYSGTDSFGLKVASTTNRTLQLRAIAGFTTHITINEAASETSHKLLVRVTGDVVEVFYNGTKITGTMTGLSTYAWSEYEVTGNNSFVGKTKELTIFDTALSDNECINLTTI